MRREPSAPASHFRCTEPTPLAFLKQCPPRLSDTLFGRSIILNGTGCRSMQMSNCWDTMTWSFDCSFLASTVQLTRVRCSPATTQRPLFRDGSADSSDGGLHGGGGVATCPKEVGRTGGPCGAVSGPCCEQGPHGAGRAATTAGSAGAHAGGRGRPASRGRGTQRGSIGPGRNGGVRLRGPASSSKVPSLSLGALVSTSAHASLPP
mmetsp:Transcript_80782/g.237398  ORF Transcript_80782/g.237398 Transcript_80782/m.237398 type:complete len:206 (+) Transcript_80782:560-1177(+)